jgi:hypothetical protein
MSLVKNIGIITLCTQYYIKKTKLSLNSAGCTCPGPGSKKKNKEVDVY